MRDTEIFEGKKLSDLLKDIHDVTIQKRETISGIISTLTSLLNTAEDAVVLAPVLREFYDVSVKNDEQLVKIATVVQRVISADAYQKNPAGDPDGFMSDDEKEQLLNNVISEMNVAAAEINSELQAATKNLNDDANSL